MTSQLSFLISALLAATLSLTDGLPLSSTIESGLSGDDSRLTSRHPVVDAAYVLQADVRKLLNEFLEQNSQVEGTYYEIRSPINSSADGCFKFHFNKSRCLKRIYAGLHQYEDQMQYVKGEFESHLVDGIIFRTRNLQRTVKEIQEMHANDDAIPQQVLPTDSAWIRNVVVNAILRSYHQFLIHAHRALRYMPK